MVKIVKQAVTTDSKVVRVVVYAGGRAQVFRHCEVSLVPGEHTVHVTGLWSKVDRSTLQVGLQKDSPIATLRGVQFNTVESVEDVRPTVAELRKKIQEVEEKRDVLRDKLTLLSKSEAAYAAVRSKIVGANLSVEQGSKPAPVARNPEQWKEVMAFLLTAMRANAEQRKVFEAEDAGCQGEVAALDQKLRALGSQHVIRTSKDVAELLLTVPKEEGAAAEVPVRLKLVLSYLVSGANWTPMYDLRIDSKARSMQVAYNATVQNSTGEDWHDVAVELSTAAATMAGSMPELRSWVIREYVAPSYSSYGGNYLMDMACEVERCEKRSEAKSMTNMMQQMMPSAAPQSAPPPPRPRDFAVAAVSSAAVSKQGGSSTFSVTAPATIRSDNQPVKVTVALLTFGVHFRYSAVPKLDPSVYLKVKAVNTSDFDLLAGKANVFSDNQLVSNTRLDTVAPGEEFWTFLGTDDDIVVKRTKVPHHTVSTAGGFLSTKKKRREFTFNYVAKSLKTGKDAEELVIWDQYPIEQDKRIVLSYISPEQGPASNDTACERRAAGAKTGGTASRIIHKVNDERFIEWFVNVAGGEEVRFSFGFALEYPLDVTVGV